MLKNKELAYKSNSVHSDFHQAALYNTLNGLSLMQFRAIMSVIFIDRPCVDMVATVKLYVTYNDVDTSLEIYVKDICNGLKGI